MSEFDGKAVAIVGATHGVGPAVVEAFLQHGANVVVDETSNRYADLKQLSIASLDGASSSDISAFLDKCESAIGPLDVLIMIAPPVKPIPVFDIDEKFFRDTVDRELIFPILCLQEAARRMVKRCGGRLISFVSMSGKTGVHPRVSPFAASKGGLIAFTRSLASEIAAHGVTANVVATALFDVQVAKMADPTHAIAGIPVGRPGRSEEAAQAALYLASRNAGFVTGETMNLSGGRFMD